MARRPRLAAQAARASLQTPIPRLSDNEDEDMDDVPPTDAPTPQEDEEDDNEDEVEGDDEDDQNEQEEAPTPSRAERYSQSATPRRRGRGRGRGRGRPSRVQSMKNDGSDDGNDASDTPAPRRRGGFRGNRGGRWANRRAGTARAAQAPIDDEGNVLNVVNDEIELPEDPEGEEKIDKNGELQNGREYRVRTFTLLGRGKRLYMLSTEPARCIGFRDSYLFFQKHKHLFKIIIDDEEKRDLIERELIPHSYKGRSIGVVTARSVFREFGAKIIIGGKKVTDDYDTAGARERGDVEGELAVPDDRIPTTGDVYNRNQYVAWHGASSVYHQNMPTVPMPNGKLPAEGKRKRTAVTSDNWMLEHARDASRFNSILRATREENVSGVYDIHTNSVQYPKNLQPTHARWEEVNDESDMDDDIEVLSANFSKLHPVYARNYRIHDLCLESAPHTNLPDPGFGLDGTGLTNISQSILDELPADCRIAFDEAAEHEMQWRSKWLTESVDGHRARILASTEWYPK